MNSIYTLAIGTFVPMLQTLSELLDKGAEHARAKHFAASVLAHARLAPDMFSLAQQVQLACDQSFDAVVRLTRQPQPSFEHDEQTFDQLKTRIAKTIAHLQQIEPAAFDGAEDRAIEIALQDDLVLELKGGLQLLKDWSLPQFYLHVVTA